MSQNKVSKFKKISFKAGVDEIDLIIPEFPSDGLGSRLWPSSLHLCKYLINERVQLKGKTILELGCGKGMPGILARKLGANVILSDHSSECVENRLNQCLQVNGVEGVCVVDINWGEVNENVVNLPPLHIIISSDSFYDSACFELLTSTISYLLHRNPSCVAVCAYEERSVGCGIEMLLSKWSLKATILPSISPTSFTDGSITRFEGFEEIMQGNEIKMYEITSKLYKKTLH